MLLLWSQVLGRHRRCAEGTTIFQDRLHLQRMTAVGQRIWSSAKDPPKACCALADHVWPSHPHASHCRAITRYCIRQQHTSRYSTSQPHGPMALIDLTSTCMSLGPIRYECYCMSAVATVEQECHASDVVHTIHPPSTLLILSKGTCTPSRR